jgi:glycosyltransferase involved in cell wall biosynthesis
MADLRPLRALRDARDGPSVAPAARSSLRILHVVTDLRRGGAETMLARLVAAMRGGAVEQSVVSLCGDGPVAESLCRSGAKVTSVDLRSPLAAAELARLAFAIRRAEPDVVHCWMYHANLIGGLVARATTRAPVVWGLRSGSPAVGVVGARTARIARAAARLSRRLPAAIVCPSEATADAHAEDGYARERIAVIPNGFDTVLFRPAAAVRAAARAALGVGRDEAVVGIVANVTPVKDHESFVAAAALLGRDLPAARFLLCGDGASPANRELSRWIAATGIAGRFLLLGQREGVHDLLPALDLFTLCSRREAFPNALGEAMACALPCVATAVGGVPELAGRAARLVPASDPRALADAWRDVLLGTAEQRAALGRAARRRIVDLFSIEVAAARHAELYAELAARPRGRFAFASAGAAVGTR